MKKIIISISFILSFIIAFGQPNEIQRSTGANTLIDPNLGASRSFRQPVFNDTTAANNSFPTLDSVGKIIFTRDVMGMWVRVGYPKRWVSVGAGGSSIPTLDQVIVAGPSTDEFINFFDNAGIVFESTGTPAYFGGGGASNGIAISDNLTDYGYLNMSAITATRDYRFPDSSGTIALLSNITGGTVTNIATGNGLTGGPITTAGTISISPTWRDSIIGLITIQRSFDNQVGGAVLTKKDTILNSGYKLFFVGTNAWLGNEGEESHDFFDRQAPVTVGLLDTAKLRTGSTSANGGNPSTALYVDRTLRFPNETGAPKSISSRWALGVNFISQVADSALINTLSGDLYGGAHIRTEWAQLAGWTGRSFVSQPVSSPLWAPAAVIGINWIHGGGTATDNMYLKDWYSAFNAEVLMQTAFDSVENYVYYNAIGGNALATNYRIGQSYMFMGDAEAVGVTGGIYGVYIRNPLAENYFGGSVQIGTNGSGTYTETPNASALLELNSTAKGVLFPRMTAAQRLAISSPANGLFVEDTDSSRYFGYTTALGWKGIAWTGEYNNGYGLNLSSNVFSLDSATVYTYVRSVAGGGGSSYTFTSPLVNTAGTVDIGGLTGLGTANQMLGMNSGATGYEYKTFAAGSAGTNFTIDHTANTVTVNIPDVTTGVTRGLLTNTTQTIPGVKSFTSLINAGGGVFTSGAGGSSNLGAFGGSTPGNFATTAAMIVEGATGTFARVSSLGTTTATLVANYNYAGIAVGQMPVTEATSGTTPLITMLMLRPTTVTNGAGATANVSGLYIEGPPTGITPTTSTSALWAKLGDIKVTNGSLLLETAGNKINIATGSNASVGVSGAMTAGTITISTTAVTASSIIILTRNTAGGTVGSLEAPTASIVAGTSFVITSSSATDTSTVNWWVIN